MQPNCPQVNNNFVVLSIPLFIVIVFFALVLTVKYKSSSGFQGDYLSTNRKSLLNAQTLNLPLQPLLLLYNVGNWLLFILNFKLKQLTKTILKQQCLILSERYAIYPSDFLIPTNYLVVIVDPKQLLFCSREH